MPPVSRVLVLGTAAPPVDGELPVHLRGHAAGIEWRIGSTRIGGFPFTPLDVVMTEVGHIDAAIRGAREGASAILLDTYGEYGLDAMRSALDIPVVGAAEAAVAEALAVGPRFGLVTVWPASMAWLYERQAARLGIGGSCVGIRYVGGESTERARPGATIEAMHRSDAGWQERIEAACREIAALGAASIVLGCTCMAPLASRIAARSGVPIVCPARAGARAVVAALGSRTAMQADPASASNDSATRLVAWVDAAVPLELPAGAAAACPVCIVDTE